MQVALQVVTFAELTSMGKGQQFQRHLGQSPAGLVLYITAPRPLHPKVCSQNVSSY